LKKLVSGCVPGSLAQAAQGFTDDGIKRIGKRSPFRTPTTQAGMGFGLYALCAEEGQFLRFEQNVGRFLRFTHIWMK
jgi:hypothetical protein